MPRVSAPLLCALALCGCSADRAGLGGDDASAPTDFGAPDLAAHDLGTSDGASTDVGVRPDTGPSSCAVPELCNGVDDDCNTATADGAGDPMVGMPCDGTDADACKEGTTTCSGGSLGCTDTTGDSPEICNGADDDCDGMIDEAGATGEVTSWPDADHDGYGNAALPTMACSTPAGNVANHDDCNDADGAAHPTAAEACNGRDDDCDGMLDDGATCGCPLVMHGTHVYLFCNDSMSWSAAEGGCASVGYHLATIDDAGENTWVADTARAANDTDWWIGANDLATEGTWTWVSGTTPLTTHWHAGQPNGGTAQNCVATNQYHDDTWNDLDCVGPFPRVCEAGP